MKLVELLNRANEGYPDEYLSAYYDEETGEYTGSLDKQAEDRLAEYVVVELMECFDPRLFEEKQIEVAVRILNDACEDLQETIKALNGERCRWAGTKGHFSW